MDTSLGALVNSDDAAISMRYLIVLLTWAGFVTLRSNMTASWSEICGLKLQRLETRGPDDLVMTKSRVCPEL